MGTHLIPSANSVHEAADHIGEPPLTAAWSYAEGGVLFKDTARSDAQCAALYGDYVPSGKTDIEHRRPDPPEVQAAVATLKAFLQANPSSVTDAQSATLHRAQTIILRYHHGELNE